MEKKSRRPKSFLEITDHGKHKKISDDKNEEDFPGRQPPRNSYKRDSLFKDAYSIPKEIIDYSQDSGLSRNFIREVDLNAKEISKNNKSLEQKIKSELSGVNIFKKGKHLLKTAISREYREKSADDFIDSQLQRTANFSESIRIIYSRLDDDLRKNVRNLDNLEERYFSLKRGREKVKNNIQKNKKDLAVLKNALDDKKNQEKRDELEMSINNSQRLYRKQITRLDELNNALYNNIKEREFDYKSEIIFEKYTGAFKKIYDTAESEIRKIDRVKGLYLDAIRGGKIVKNLEKSFEEIFSSLRVMDDILLRGVNDLISESSVSRKGRIRQLSQEKDENSRRLLKTFRENYVPSATKLNNLVENYVRGKR